MKTGHILYKNPAQSDTLDIVQYAWAVLGKDLRPDHSIERNWPPYVTQLPSIYDRKTGILYSGFNECVRYYEMKSETTDIVEKAKEFKTENPRYRIKPA